MAARSSDDLYIAHRLDGATLRRLADWDVRVSRARRLPSTRWQDRAGLYLSAASTSASTRIEGNQLSLWHTDLLLSGVPLEPDSAAVHDVREVERYAEAQDLVEELAARQPFDWHESLLQQLNAVVLRGLPNDSRGAWRDGPVTVGAFYSAPHASAVPGLVRGLVDWLRSSDEHVIVRAALLHLNLAAIHPWFDGNGRTTRLACLLEVDRVVRVRALVSVEPLLAARQSAYVRRLREAVGMTWDPANHLASTWVAWYVRLHLDALAAGEAVVEATYRDVQVVLGALERRDEPADWGPLIMASAFGPFTTALAQRMYGSSPSAARAMIARLVTAGWFVAEGQTRARRYRPSARVGTLALESPGAARRWAHAESDLV
jgi:Fic family protein